MKQPDLMPAHIRGEEQLCDPTTPLGALVAFYKAFNSRDMPKMTRVWLNDDAASMDNPIGGIRRGWKSIREGYDRLFNGSTQVFVEFYDYTLHCDESAAVAVGRERGHYTVDGVKTRLEIRTSRLFVRAHGEWKQLHHHGSIEDGVLLAKYQTAILGTPIRIAD